MDPLCGGMVFHTPTRQSARRGLIAAMVALVALLVGIAVANGGQRHRRIQHPVVPPQIAARITANRRTLAHHFPLLRSSHRASDGLAVIPEPFAGELAQQATKPVPAGGLGEPDPTMATYVGLLATSARGEERAWVIPGPNDICIATLPVTNKGGSLSCQADRTAAEGKMVGWEEGPQGHSTVIGIAPNGAPSVAVHESGGREKDVQTQHGVWVLNDDPNAVSVSIGSLSTSIPSPVH
jgi:hypothetical protein